MVVVLDNIRSLYNVGSIFRTADGAGISRVYLCGITPGPLDEFGIVRSQFEKVALGAGWSVEWERRESVLDTARNLQGEGFAVLAVEQDRRSRPYWKWESFSGGKPVALVMGGEVGGVSPGVLDAVDGILEIPMRGEKESLNVSVAFGVVVYEALKD